MKKENLDLLVRETLCVCVYERMYERMNEWSYFFLSFFLSFFFFCEWTAGDVITVLDAEDDGWWEGTCNGFVLLLSGLCFGFLCLLFPKLLIKPKKNQTTAKEACSLRITLK